MSEADSKNVKLHGPRPDQKKKWTWWKIALNCVSGTIILCACLVLANIAYLNFSFNEPFFVNGMSMYPTLNADGKRKTSDGYRSLTWNDGSNIDGDIVDYGFAKIGDKGNWRSSLNRMDIVVTYYPEDYVIDGSTYTLKSSASPKIKRLIGMPNETLTFDVVRRGSDSKGLFESIGGSEITYVEAYSPDYNSAWGKTTIIDSSGNSQVLKPLYDESDFPDVDGEKYPAAQISSGANSMTWSLSNDEYFVMGDNRGGTKHSLDSREKGPVKDFMIIGKAYLITSQRELKLQSDGTLKANFNLGLAWWPWDYKKLGN